MNDEQIKYMVSRFLMWRLPENFNPDGGISFKPYYNEHTMHPMKSEPVGTNLFDAVQTEEMVRYLVSGLPDEVPNKGVQGYRGRNGLDYASELEYIKKLDAEREKDGK